MTWDQDKGDMIEEISEERSQKTSSPAGLESHKDKRGCDGEMVFMAWETGRTIKWAEYTNRPRSNGMKH